MIFFIVGDAHQRIYRNKAVLSKCGINVRGRARKLRINYRTTEEIRKYAFGLLKGVSFDDMDEEYDDGDKGGCFPYRQRKGIGCNRLSNVGEEVSVTGSVMIMKFDDAEEKLIDRILAVIPEKPKTVMTISPRNTIFTFNEIRLDTGQRLLIKADTYSVSAEGLFDTDFLISAIGFVRVKIYDLTGSKQIIDNIP